MKSFVWSMKSAWHHGKGFKHLRQNNNGLALSHFEKALKYAELSRETGSVPVEMECVARTLVRLGEYEQAKEYAQKAGDLYRTHGVEVVSQGGLRRIAKLMEVIEGRGASRESEGEIGG